MRLEPLQQKIFRAVVGDASLHESAALVRAGALTPEDRLGIYAEMYWLRMRDSLRTDYPFVRRVLGDEDFEILVARHLKRRPSTHYSLGRLGLGFSDTLREASLALEWLPDLAALEWARAESFISADAPTLQFSELGKLNEDVFARARLVMSPSVRTLHPVWDVQPIWRALEHETDWRTHNVEKAQSPLVVWRQGFAVFHVALTAIEAQAISLAQQALNLPAVCEAFAETTQPAQAAFQAIGSWVSEGMVAALEVDAA